MSIGSPRPPAHDMSGQLVGEVLAARAEHLADLTQAQTLALVAIAEKCHAESREGSVRVSHIQAVIGKSRRTAVRTLEQLKGRGLIRVVKRGYKSHGVARASIYGLSVLAPLKMAQSTEGACATQDGATNGHALAPNRSVLAPNPRVVAPSMGGAHDGSLDGSLDGGARGPADVVTGPPGYRELPPDPEPSRTCPRHPADDTPCRTCQAAREKHDAWKTRQIARRRALAELQAADIGDCLDCDTEGWFLGSDGTPCEPSMKCVHVHLWHAHFVARGVFAAIDDRQEARL